ncbi:MAG: hypothetical protein ACE5E1_00895 [Phycisphaerae bacterium]
MQTGAAQHRHFKTLIVLVIAMTGGTFLLFWIARFAPITPLRASVAPWDRIMVRAEPARAPRGFFHYRIGPAGRLFQSQAWLEGLHERGSHGTIHILLTCEDRDLRVTPAQAKTLSSVLSKLRREYAIPTRRVAVERRFPPLEEAGLRGRVLPRT